jgi:hypothetical protein
VAVVVLLPLLSRSIARRRTRTRTAAVEQRLREAALGVAREVVAPVRGVLRTYAQSQRALHDAFDGHPPPTP